MSTTRRTSIAPEAAAASDAPIETPLPEVVTPESGDTIHINFYNQAVKIAEEQSIKITNLEKELKEANQVNADLQEELDQANETISNMAAEAAEGVPADSNKILFTDEDGDTYEITQPTFRYRGREYKSAEAVDAHRDVLQELVEAKAFIFKRQ